MNKLRKFGFLVLAVICALFVFTSCRRDKGPTAEEAAARISTTVDKTVVTKDFVVNNSIVLEGVTFTVTWESNNAVAKVGTEKVGSNGEAKENGGFYLVSIAYETNTADQNVTLTATVANGKDTAKKSISFTVPKFTTMTYAEYAAADKETSLTVDGIVTGIMSKTKGDQDNALYLNALDNTGGFYIYKMEKDPVTEGIKEGMTVRASGQKDLYSGTYEIVDPSVRIIDETIKTVAPVDLTEAYKAAADLKDAKLVGGQSLLVTVKGVTITTADDSNGYHKFKLGKLESYIRISSSNCPLNADETKAFKDGFASHTGWLANATGIVSIYNGAFYLTPVTADAFEYLSLPELSDAEEVANEKESLSLSKINFVADGSLTLPVEGSVYKDVKISWASDNELVTIDENGVATIKLGKEEATVKLTATLTSGTTTDTKEFTLTLAERPEVTYSVIANPVAGTAYKLGFKHTNLDNIELFATGEMDGFYYGTTETVANGVDVYLEETTGGFYMYAMVGTAKKYMNIVKSYDEAQDKTFFNVKYEDAGSSVWTYNTTLNTMTTKVDDVDYLLGTGSSKTYKTISANKVEYASSTCIAHFYGEGAPVVYKPVSTVAVSTAYKFALVQANLDNAVLYLSGEMDGYYFATTEAVAAAVDVYLEETTGGFYMYFMDGTTKTYINVVRAMGDDNKEHDNVKFDTTATTVWTWDADLKTVVTTIGEDVLHLGTRNDKKYTTISANKVSYNGFVAQFYLPSTDADEPSEEPTPELKEEPATTNKTIAEIKEIPTADEMTATYKISGVVSGWGKTGTDAAAAKYGNFILKNGEDTILVYGATATRTALTWNGTTGKYLYENAQDFLTNELTSTINIGATVELLVVKTSYDGAAQVNAIVLTVTPYVKTDADYVAEAKEALTIAETVTNELTLPATGLNETTITWVVKEGTAITIAAGVATVIRPEFEADDATVVLTATIKKGEATATKDFTVVVTKLPEDPNIAKVNADLEALTIVETVTNELTLPAAGTVNESAIVWTVKSGTAIVITEGVVTITRPAFGEENATVVLTATLTLGKVVKTKDFTVTVSASTDNPDEDLVIEDLAAIVLPATVTTELTLPAAGSNESVITWTVKEGTAIVITEGAAVITQPEPYAENATVVLTATVTKGLITKTKDFTVVVEAKVDPNIALVKAAAEDLELTEPADLSKVIANFTLPLTVEGHEGVVVSWTSSDEAIAIDGANATVTRPGHIDGNATVTLTATVTLGVATEKVVFENVIVLAKEYATVAEFLVAKPTEAASLKGYITAVNKIGKGSFVLTDEEGTSIFCYEDTEVTLGDKVTLKAIYTENKGDGFAQIGTLSEITVISNNNDLSLVSGEAVEIEIDDVETFVNASGATVAKIYEEYGAKLLSIEGYVTLSGSYYNLASTQGGKTFINLYTHSGIDRAALEGLKVKVLGFARGGKIGSYGYLSVQVQSIEDLSTEAEKNQVKLSKDLALLNDFTITDTLTLPQLKYGTAEWVITEGTAIELNDGTYIVKQPEINEENATVEFNVTVTVGDAVGTKKVVVTVRAKVPEGVGQTYTADLNTIAKTNTKYVTSTTTSGWVATNCAVLQGGTTDSNPTFKMVGTTSDRAVCLNGKTSAVGSLTSPVLNNGITKLTFNYGLPFSDTKIGLKVEIIDEAGTVLATKTISNTSATKLTKYTEEWTLDTAIQGNFKIVIKNTSPSNKNDNKDRTAVFNISWVSYN